MSRPSHARYLAPFALVAAVVLVFLVARPELGGSSGAKRSTSPSTGSKAKSAQTSAAKKKRAAAKTPPKTYTVKPGDVLGSISETTGVAVVDLLDYNDIDAQSLRPGQKLKLAP